MFHSIRPLVQFKPARAKKSIASVADVRDIKNIELEFWDQKIDGERYLIQTNRPTALYLHGVTSRRESSVTGRFVEKTDRVGHITNAPLTGLHILDSEFVSSGDMSLVELPSHFWDKLIPHPHMDYLKNKFGGAIPTYPHVSNTVSIMGSLGPEAVRKQQERGLIWAYCFDIIQFNNQNATSLAQHRRRELLSTLLSGLNPENGIILMPTWKGLTQGEVEELFYLVTDNGGEGLIRKDPLAKYNAASAWYKLKADYPCDAVYTGRSKLGAEGKTGQMLGLAASLEIGVYHNGVLVPIGWISGIRNGHAGLQTPEEHTATWTGKVVECRHNGLQEGNTLRHPRFRRHREDKNPTDCTWEALYAESR